MTQILDAHPPASADPDRAATTGRQLLNATLWLIVLVAIGVVAVQGFLWTVAVGQEFFAELVDNLRSWFRTPRAW